MSTKRLLGVFAHPDDEGTMSGALLQYSTLGVETGLVCATRGEEGEIADAALATPENLGQVREGEMRAAAEVLGVHNLWFLDYRDSGMAGTPENANPRAFAQVRSADAVGKLVGIIREFRPQVLVTFDETGGYGHPDHIAIYRHTTSAFHAAADAVQYPELGPAHSVAKLYYTGFPRSALQAMGEWMQSQQYEGSFSGLDAEKLGLPDELVSIWLNVEQWQTTKDRSWAMHRTQMDPNNLMAKLPPEVLRKWRGRECYQLAASRVGPDVAGENDLFARI
ncbi:MAG TPA: PIG-L family deacetylase [Ktedonobacteraceae bacterium]|jgi:LmbE family N-acetylglucosaminyl deacetylase|nr:PIG-L family deacetylase [Ktedonobacteraceae bacterium]